MARAAPERERERDRQRALGLVAVRGTAHSSRSLLASAQQCPSESRGVSSLRVHSEVIDRRTYYRTMPPSTKKKFINHATKLKIIQMKEAGKGNTAIGRELGLSESTV